MPITALAPDALETSAILTQTLEKLSLAQDLTAITQTVADAARRLARADGATFVLRDQDKCYYADEDAISPLWKGQRFPMSACISGWCMLEKKVVCVPDIYQDNRIPQDAYRPTFVKSLCMVPIREADPIGAIGHYWGQENAPSPEQVKALQVLANSAAVALENLELRNSIRHTQSEGDGWKTKAGELEAAMHSLAHDLRNPVGMMSGLAELARLECSKQANPQLARYLDLISETAQQTDFRIERILALYRLTSCKLEKSRMDLSQLSRQLLAKMRVQLAEREVREEVAEGLVVHADPSLMQLVLENLFSNALKYSGKKPFSRIEVGSLAPVDNLTTIFVRDNGDGFNPADTHKLFRPLSRLHSEADFKGTGLGLFSVARIIELHGGRIRAEARPKEGATFFFSLPLASA